MTTTTTTTTTIAPAAFSCPFASCADSTGRSADALFRHIAAAHAADAPQVVCPVCAAAPGGDANLVSRNIHAHIRARHMAELSAPAVPGLDLRFVPLPTPLVHHRWAPGAACWQAVGGASAEQPVAVAADATETPAAALVVLQQNVWFSRQLMAERTALLLQCLRHHMPHVVCLQEITDRALCQLLADEFVRQHYAVTDVDGSSYNHSYGVVMLSRLKVASQATLWSLPSRQGRSLLMCHYSMPDGRPISVATIHLESVDSAPTRAEQLELIGELLEPLVQQNPVVLTGDFNIDDQANVEPSSIGLPLENLAFARCLPSFVDIWPAEHPDLRGATRIKLDRGLQLRFDRVFVAAPGASPAKTHIQIINDQPVLLPDGIQSSTVSDHWGLLARLIFP